MAFYLMNYSLFHIQCIGNLAFLFSVHYRIPFQWKTSISIINTLFLFRISVYLFYNADIQNCMTPKWYRHLVVSCIGASGTFSSKTKTFRINVFLLEHKRERFRLFAFDLLNTVRISAVRKPHFVLWNALN